MQRPKLDDLGDLLLLAFDLFDIDVDDATSFGHLPRPDLCMQAIAPPVGQRLPFPLHAHTLGVGEHGAEDIHLDCSARPFDRSGWFAAVLLGHVGPVSIISLGWGNYQCIQLSCLNDGLNLLARTRLLGVQGDFAWSATFPL